MFDTAHFLRRQHSWRMEKVRRAEQTAEKCRRYRRRGRLQPPARMTSVQGFSPGLIVRVVEIIRAAQTAECEGNSCSLMHVKGPWNQTAAEAGRMIASVGRLKPPSSSVVRTFFSGLCSPILCRLERHG